MDSLSGYTSVFRGPPPALNTQGTKLDDVGVLASTRVQLDRLGVKLKDAGIETVRLQPNMADERNLPGVRLTTMHRAKGLEFQAVAIPFLARSTFPSPAALKSAVDEVDRRNILQQQKSLLHVAATRAKKILRVSWSGEPSAFLSDAIAASTTLP
jgi:superfamily I DNA/RNA helicase